MLLGSACDYFELMLSYLRLPSSHMVPGEIGAEHQSIQNSKKKKQEEQIDIKPGSITQQNIFLDVIKNRMSNYLSGMHFLIKKRLDHFLLLLNKKNKTLINFLLLFCNCSTICPNLL